MATTCPKEFISTGALLVQARTEADVASKRAEQALAMLTDVAMPVARAEPIGLKDAQIGRAIGLLRQAQMAPALIAEAHASLQDAISACDVTHPTNDQIKTEMATLEPIQSVLGWR